MNAELARNTEAVLDRVQSGAEIVIERDARPPVAVLRAAEPRRASYRRSRSLSEGSSARLDADFAADVQAFV